MDYLLYIRIRVLISSVILCFFCLLLLSMALLKQVSKWLVINFSWALLRSPITARFCCIISTQYLSSSTILIMVSIRLLAFLKLNKADCFGDEIISGIINPPTSRPNPIIYLYHRYRYISSCKISGDLKLSYLSI
jgi:hypothetical protein